MLRALIILEAAERERIKAPEPALSYARDLAVTEPSLSIIPNCTLSSLDYSNPIFNVRAGFSQLP